MQVIRDTMPASLAVIAMGVVATALGGLGAGFSLLGHIFGRGSGHQLGYDQLGYDLLIVVMVMPALGGAVLALGLAGARAGWATLCHAKRAFSCAGIAAGVTKAMLGVVGITFGVAGTALGALGAFNGVTGAGKVMGGVGGGVGVVGAWIAFIAARRGISLLPVWRTPR